MELFVCFFLFNFLKLLLFYLQVRHMIRCLLVICEFNVHTKKVCNM